MNTSRIIVLLVAVLAGGGAFYLAMSGNQDAKNAITDIAVAQTEIPMTKVLFARKDIPQGGTIEANHMKWVEWPEKDVPEFLITDRNTDYLAALPEMRARRLIRKDEPIYQQNTVGYGDRGLMAAIMTPGMRAVSLRLTEDRVAGGFILPGDRVDIYGSMENNSDDMSQNTSQSKLILSNVRVLAIDQVFNTESGTTAIVGKVVTLEVSPGQVPGFLQAKNSSDLTLILRSVYEDGGGVTQTGPASPDQVVVIWH